MSAIFKEESRAFEHIHNPRPAPSGFTLHPHELLDMLLNRRFGVEYQPVVDTLPGETANCASCTALWNTA